MDKETVDKIKALGLVVEQQAETINKLKKGYFEQYDPDNKANRFTILLHFGTAAINTNIINDYNKKLKIEIDKILVDL